MKTLPARSETTVFINEAGLIVVRQERRDNPIAVVLNGEDAETIAKWMLEMVEQRRKMTNFE